VTNWPGASLQALSPTIWAFNFTEPMKRILEIGPTAQSALLPLISDTRIKPQVIILPAELATSAPWVLSSMGWLL
jgi:hypothetical protein